MDFNKTLTLNDLVSLMGYETKTFPIIGKVAKINGKIITEQEEVEYPEGNIHINIVWNEEGWPEQMYIGHKYAGPMFHFDGEVWRNLYSNFNFGKNPASGGTWVADSSEGWNSLLECWDNRLFKIKDMFMEKHAYTEGWRLKREISLFIRDYAHED